MEAPSSGEFLFFIWFRSLHVVSQENRREVIFSPLNSGSFYEYGVISKYS